MLVIWNLNLMNLRFASNEVSGFFFFSISINI